MVVYSGTLMSAYCPADNTPLFKASHSKNMCTMERKFYPKHVQFSERGIQFPQGTKQFLAHFLLQLQHITTNRSSTNKSRIQLAASPSRILKDLNDSINRCRKERRCNTCCLHWMSRAFTLSWTSSELNPFPETLYGK